MRNSTKNAIAAVVAIVLAVVIVIACGIGSSWFTNSDIATWFNSWGKGEQTEVPDETPADEGGMQIGESAGSGISLMSAKIAAADFEEYGISPMAESAQQLTATITPENADNKAVDWSIAWVNPSSSWASGKTVTDYVTVTPTSDGALTANVSCLQAFGEQVKVTVTSRMNSNATASATVDYRRKLQGVDFTAIATNNSNSNLTLSALGGSSVTWNWLPITTDTSTPNQWSKYTNNYSAVWDSVYTIDDTISSQSVIVGVSSALKTELDKVVTLENERAFYNKTYTYSETTGMTKVLSQFTLMGSYEYGFDGLFKALCGSTYEDGDYDVYYAYLMEDLYTALKAASTDLVITVNATTASGAEYSKQYSVNISDTSLSVLVQTLALNKVNVIF